MWPTLAADRAAWRGAIHGALLDVKPPRRAAAAAADKLIDVAIADARRLAFRACPWGCDSGSQVTGMWGPDRSTKGG